MKASIEKIDIKVSLPTHLRAFFISEHRIYLDDKEARNRYSQFRNNVARIVTLEEPTRIHFRQHTFLIGGMLNLIGPVVFNSTWSFQPKLSDKIMLTYLNANTKCLT